MLLYGRLSHMMAFLLKHDCCRAAQLLDDSVLFLFALRALGLDSTLTLPQLASYNNALLSTSFCLLFDNCSASCFYLLGDALLTLLNVLYALFDRIASHSCMILLCGVLPFRISTGALSPDDSPREIAP